MPTVSMFLELLFGCIIPQKNSKSAHIHVYYQGYKAVVNVLNCDLIEG